MEVRAFNDIRRLRLAMHPPLKQRELGRAVGCTQSDMSAYERGVVVPTLEMVLRICRTLGREPKDVFFGVNERVSAYFRGEPARGSPAPQGREPELRQ